MKKYLPIWVLMLMVSIAITAKGQVYNKGLDRLSSEIRTAFEKKYASTSEENWVRVDNSILISFRSGDEYYDAFFDEKGKWLRTETAIRFEQLPKNVQDSLKTGEFSSWQKGSVLKVELPGAAENYRIYVYSKDWNEMEVNFDKSGKRII